MSQDPLLHVDDLVLRDAVLELAPLRLNVRPGEIFAVIGPGGSGKTLLCEGLNGLHRAVRGTLRFAGEDITQIGPQARRARGISFCPQTPTVFPALSARDNVCLGLGRQAPAHDGVVNELAGLIPGLNKALARPTTRLTAAERKRVDLARTLIDAPRLVIMDAPGLCLPLQELVPVVRTLAAAKIAVIVTERAPNLSRRVADNVLMLHSGHVAALGPAEIVSRDPAVCAACAGTV